MLKIILGYSKQFQNLKTPQMSSVYFHNINLQISFEERGEFYFNTTWKISAKYEYSLNHTTDLLLADIITQHIRKLTEYSLIVLIHTILLKDKK